MITDVNAVTDRIFFVPLWVRWIVFILLLLIFSFALAIVIIDIYQDKFNESTISTSISLIQSTSIAAIIILFMFFVERGYSSQRISDLTKEFLIKDVPNQLKQIDYGMDEFQQWQDRINYNSLISKTKIDISYNYPSNTAYYIIHARERAFGLKVDANVKRFNVVILCELKENLSLNNLEGLVEETLLGARDAGYNVSKPTFMKKSDFPQNFPWQKTAAIILYQNRDENYLYSIADREHIAQDMAIMIRSFLREAIDHGLL